MNRTVALSIGSVGLVLGFQAFWKKMHSDQSKKKMEVLQKERELCDKMADSLQTINPVRAGKYEALIPRIDSALEAQRAWHDSTFTLQYYLDVTISKPDYPMTAPGNR